jgi:hypothetical protein
MKLLLPLFIFCGIAAFARAQDAGKIIKTYFSGFEKKDWNIVAAQLAPGFNFTSAAPDDHIPLAEFKTKCWPQSQHIKKVEFEKIVTDGNSAFAIYNLTTNDNKVIRNTEYYTFSKGKIKSIECFFGGTGAGYPTNAK